MKVFPEKSGAVTAVNNVSFEVPIGSFFTLLGPSGCGKTTTLRCLAGLERPDSGEIKIGDQVVSSSNGGIFIPTHRRHIGMVFQSYAIWPHMTVAENIGFPLKNRGYPRHEMGPRISKVLELVGMKGYESRPATKLSGGQQQRVAVARALVAEPAVLLFDEPLSNLDARLREDMRHELRSLQLRLGITAIYVTHDQQEALAMSDHIAVMNSGNLIEIGAPWEIYHAPRSLVTAEFIGLANRLEGSVQVVESDAVWVSTEIGPVLCKSRGSVKVGDPVVVFVRPESLEIVPEATDGPNVMPGVIRSVQFLGEQVDCWVQVKEKPLRFRQSTTLFIQAGQTVHMRFHPSAGILLENPAK